MYSQFFRDFTEFLTFMCDIISTPPPLSKNVVLYALSISFSLQKGTQNITGDVWSSEVQI